MPDVEINRELFQSVDVCVCTFRRASVVDLLASLAKQVLPAGWRMRVVVADNDDAPSAQEIVNQAFWAHGLDGHYVHAPARNISVARNACLDAAVGDLIAFVDDDEIARPDWIARLIAARDASGAGVVFGKVKAVYAADAPAWMREADFHSTPPPIRNGQIAGGYTCNVLMKRNIVGALRFNPAFGRSGGEDTTFFGQLQSDAVPMVYAADAVVEEPVAPGRYSLDWMRKRAYRAGQTWGLLELRNGRSRLRLVAAALVKMAYCWGLAAVSAWSPAAWRKAVLRAQLHAGVFGAATGKAPLDLYGETHG